MVSSAYHNVDKLWYYYIWILAAVKNAHTNKSYSVLLKADSTTTKDDKYSLPQPKALYGFGHNYDVMKNGLKLRLIF